MNLESVTNVENSNSDAYSFECPAYERERFQLIQELGWLGVDKISLKVLLGNGSRQSRVN